MLRTMRYDIGRRKHAARASNFLIDFFLILFCGTLEVINTKVRFK